MPSLPRILVWFWSGGGGGSRYAINLAWRLQRDFPDVTLSLRADDPSTLPAELPVLRADVVSARARPIETLLRLASSRHVLTAHIEAARADLVIVPMNFASAAPLSVGLGKPLVYVSHDPAPHPGDYAIRAQIWTQRFILARAAATIAPSRYAAGELRRRVPAKRLHVAPLSAIVPPAERSRPPLREAAPVRLLLLGRLLAYKGLDLLAEALAKIASRDDWRLRIAGFGDAFPESLRSLPQLEQIKSDRLADAEVDAEIARADVLLAPYLSATQSGVIADAMAQGVPAIATPVGALAEQVGDAGWMAESATSEAYAAALTRMLDARASYAEISAKALERARFEVAHDYWSWLRDLA